MRRLDDILLAVGNGHGGKVGDQCGTEAIGYLMKRQTCYYRHTRAGVCLFEFSFGTLPLMDRHLLLFAVVVCPADDVGISH